MDVDETENQAAAPPATDTEAAVAELGSVLEQIGNEPNNTLLLRRQVDLMLQVGMLDEAVDSATSVSQVSFLGEALWRRVLTAKVASLAVPVSLAELAQVLELFQAAEGEYLCTLS